MSYADFLDRRSVDSRQFGFEADAPTWLYPFQQYLFAWAVRRGRSAVFADCGLGKTPIQLAWADAIVRRNNRPVLIVAPLSTIPQALEEAAKFGVAATRSRDGRVPASAQVVITNYERLSLFEPSVFEGVVCDESSILKNCDGVTRHTVTAFLSRMPYRLLCTATAAPNDYIELGTSSEALGEMGHADMLSRFFTNDERSVSPLSYATEWRFKGHAEGPFWRWMATWAKAVRTPRDLGFQDDRFQLPPLLESVHVVAASRPLAGKLFVTPAETLHEQREERRATLAQRCEHVGEMASAHQRPFLAWAHLNAEGDLLARLVPGAVQVSGADSDDRKEEIFEAFRHGQIRALVTKPKIAAFGLNWQHCADMSLFPSHSYEQYYQAVRRCWRFGQASPVRVDIVTTQGEADVLGNLQRKAAAATRMFAEMTTAMTSARGVSVARATSGAVNIPAWMEATICNP